MGDKKVTFAEVDQLSRKLAQKVASCQPDCVISIEEGGCPIGTVVARELNLPHYSIRVEKWYYKFPNWFKHLVRSIENNAPWPLNKIFYNSANLATRGLNRVIKPRVKTGFNGPVSLKAKILLVDDDIGSGATIKSALSYLRQKGFENIKTAAIRGDKGFTVDYSAAPTTPILSFPWPWRN